MLPGRELDQIACLYCPECADERPFERPECLDGHGADCPERACVVCGTALLIAPLTQPADQDAAGVTMATPAGPPAARVVRPAGPATAPRRSEAQPEQRRPVGAGHGERSPA
jgi:hypothetical protein